MEERLEQADSRPPVSQRGITRLAVKGFKSIGAEQGVEIGPLTVLAGANSSGKSSMMQPLLLLKQTLEASYDPGALLLSGPNVKFTSATQLFSKSGDGASTDSFSISVGVHARSPVSMTFAYKRGTGMDIREVVYAADSSTISLRPGMSHGQIMSVLPQSFEDLRKSLSNRNGVEWQWRVERNRCFLSLGLYHGDPDVFPDMVHVHGFLTESGHLREPVSGIIHVPGLRGNPERTYKTTTAVGPAFPGTFENYVASIVTSWQSANDPRLSELGDALQTLGLTWGVRARQVDDTAVELQVGRLHEPGRDSSGDMVSIADVGFGVSQTLPVLVALLAAEPGQLVYIEQPEIHLHPRAQTAMAKVLASAAQRGVRVVVETHSALLLLGIQTLVAEGLPADLVKFHWFKRRPDTGDTEVFSADLDEAGAFESDWPEDFAEVALKAESRYLDAVEERHLAAGAS